MQRKNRLIVLLLAIVLLLCACDTTIPSDTETTNTAAESETSVPTEARDIILASGGKASFKIIVPEDADDKIYSAANSLKDKLKKLAGCVFTIGDDYTRDGEIVDSTEEIILGNCKRTDTQKALEGLKYEDYAVVATDANIVVASYDSSAVKKAVKALVDALNDAVVEKSGDRVILKWTVSIYGEGSYANNMPTLGGIPLSSYTIVYPKDSINSAAYTLQAQFAQRYGDILPVVSDGAAETQYEILMGKTNRALSQSVYSGSSAPKSMQYYYTAADGKILLASGGLFSLAQAVEGMCSSFFRGADTRIELLVEKAPIDLMTGEIKACTADYRFMSYNILVEYEGWGSGGIIPPEVEIRKEITSELILRYKPDVAALEEVFETWHTQLPELIDDEYGFVGVTRKDGSTNRTVLIYNKSRVKVVDAGYVDIEAKATTNKRVVVWAVFEDLKTAERFSVFGTHLSVTSETDRVKEAELIADTVKTVTQKYPVPTVVMGDMNSTADAVNKLLSLCGLTKGAQSGVDHILYDTNRVNFVYKEIIGGNFAPNASDHRPVILDLQFKN